MVAIVPAPVRVPRHARRLVGAVFIAVIAVAAIFDLARAFAASRHAGGHSPLRGIHWSEKTSRGAGSGSKTAE